MSCPSAGCAATAGFNPDALGTGVSQPAKGPGASARTVSCPPPASRPLWTASGRCASCSSGDRLDALPGPPVGDVAAPARRQTWRHAPCPTPEVQLWAWRDLKQVRHPVQKGPTYLGDTLRTNVTRNRANRTYVGSAGSSWRIEHEPAPGSF